MAATAGAKSKSLKPPPRVATTHHSVIRIENSIQTENELNVRNVRQRTFFFKREILRSFSFASLRGTRDRKRPKIFDKHKITLTRLWVRCSDAAKPVQVKRLKRMLRLGFSSSALRRHTDVTGRAYRSGLRGDWFCCAIDVHDPAPASNGSSLAVPAPPWQSAPCRRRPAPRVGSTLMRANTR
jgi:hypothetical protein